jgi:hypothetical protein
VVILGKTEFFNSHACSHSLWSLGSLKLSFTSEINKKAASEGGFE